METVTYVRGEVRVRNVNPVGSVVSVEVIFMCPESGGDALLGGGTGA